MGFREILQSGEDKWYAFWDAADKKVPIHGMIDGIDKIFPSFYLFLILILAIVGYAAVTTFSGGIALPQNTTGTATLIIQDSAGNPLPDIEVTALMDGGSKTFTSGSDGKISLDNIAAGKSITIEVAADNFQPFQQKYTVEAGKEIIIQLQPLLPQERVIQLVDSSGQTLAGKKVRLQLSCENSSVLPTPSELETDNGVLTVPGIPGCGTAIGSFFADGFSSKEGILLTPENALIKFDALAPEFGTLQVEALDKTGQPLKGMHAQLFAENGGAAGDQFTNDFGLATIENIQTGKYNVAVSDPANEFGTQNSSGEVQANTLEKVSVHLSRDTVGMLEVLISDKASKAKMSGAQVKLIENSTNKVLDQKLSDAGGKAVFTIDSTEELSAAVSASGYLSTTISIGKISGKKSISAGMVKLTATNSGRIEGIVADAGGIPVENAEVQIYYSKTGFLLNVVNSKITDSNGMVKFVGVPAGNYFLRASKFPNTPRDSQNLATTLEGIAQFSIKLDVGNSTIHVKALDQDLAPVAFARVEFLTEGSRECNPGECDVKADETGAVEKIFKADKKIFVRVSSPGFENWISPGIQLYPGKTIEIQAAMEKQILTLSPSIEFSGLFEKSGGIAKEIRAGKSYTAKFKLKLPTLSSFQEAGSIIRTGVEELMQNDALILTSINAPTASVLKYTSFTPPTGIAEDEKNLSADDFKWAKINYSDSPAGIYNIELDVRVKDETVIGKKLAFNYNVFGIASDGKVKRAPLDAGLGEAKEAPGKNSEYAEAFEKIYFEGTPELCDDLFCYSGEKVFDQTAQLLVDGPPYPVIINRNLDFSFLISSNSSKVYPNAQIQILASDNNSSGSSSSGMQITAYSIKTVSGELIEGKNLAASAIPEAKGQGIPLGKLDQYKTIQGKLTLLPKETGPSVVRVNLTDGGKVIFTKTIELDTVSSDNLNLTLAPNQLGAFIPASITVTASDNQGAGVQGVAISLIKITPDKIRQKIDELLTNSNGEATFNVPASSPATKIAFEARKEGYASEPVEIVVSDKVVEFDPKELVINLTALPSNSKIEPVNIVNKTQYPFEITATSLSMDGKGFIQLDNMQNYLRKFEGTTTIPGSGSQLIEVKGSLSTLGQLLTRKTDFKGNILFTIKSQELSRTFVQKLPLTLSVSPVSSCDDESIVISGVGDSGNLWKTSVFESRIQEKFSILNACEFEQKEVPLKNLKAKIKWAGEVLGTVELSITDTESGQIFTESLSPGQAEPFFDSFNPASRGTYEGVISLIPFSSSLGKTASFQVEISGELQDQGRVLSKSFSAELKITNLSSCIKLDPSPEKGILMNSTQTTTSFNIDTSACGSIPIDFEFCSEPGNVNCSGGAADGKLFLDQYSINGVTGEQKTVEAQRKGSTLPGNYGITIQARTPGTSFRQIGIMDAVIEPDGARNSFSLDKYEFILPQKDAKDATTLTNKLLSESVQVKAGRCDWSKASKRDFFNYTKKSFKISAYGNDTIVGKIIGAIASIINGTLIIGLIIDLWNSAFGDDPCDHKDTHPLPAYIINLSGVADGSIAPDILGITLDGSASSFIDGNYDISNADAIHTAGGFIQEVGVVFENKTGFTTPNPVYSTVHFLAREHIHGDPAHAGNAHVQCGNSNFGPFFIPCQENIVQHDERFHLKFITQDRNNDLPQQSFDAVSCTDGIQLGSTGSKAVPKIRLNWNFNDTTGIKADACDAKNPNAIFCDSTQFNIMLMKRIEKFQEFLQVNNNNFACPTSVGAAGSGANDLNAINSLLSVGTGETGLKFISEIFHSPTTLEYLITVDNKSATAQNATVTVTVSNSDTANSPVIPSECVKEGVIPANQSLQFNCIFDKLSLSDFYTAEIKFTSDTVTQPGSNDAIVSFSTLAAAQNSSGGSCGLPKTTGLVFNIPGIDYWIDHHNPLNGSSVTATPAFTAAVPNVQALDDLLHFDAYLTKDGYSTDFENDFRNYYTTIAFADTPSWFFDSISNTGLASYYGASDDLTFNRKFTTSNELLSAGKYRVDVEALFGNDWRFLDGVGKPIAKISVVLNHLEDPSPNHVFYSLPFDGSLGIIASTLDRVGYGAGYTNISQPFKLNNQGDQAFSSNTSSPFIQIQTDTVNDLRKLNSLPSTRGSVFSVQENQDGSRKLIFSPSLATPVLMKVNHAGSPTPFSVIYTPLIANVPAQTGGNFTFWEGAGVCRDFTGVPVREKFNFTSDRQATPQDSSQNLPSSYALDWEKAVVSGDVFLRTIIYSPPQIGSALKSESGNETLMTASAPTFSSTISLTGISNLAFDSASSSIQSLDDILQLVGAEKICVSNSGSEERFFWNPKTIYSQKDQVSITEQVQNLVAGSTCIK